jgi:glycosyltransferase involved in cell wall biosynthesis
MPDLSVVVPHRPIDEEVDEALRMCLASLPRDCEKIVVVNHGTGFARNVNLGLKLASGDYVAVVTNDSRVVDGDVFDLWVDGTVASPVVSRSRGSSRAVSRRVLGCTEKGVGTRRSPR